MASLHTPAIGRPMTRTDAILKATGGARYASDMPLANAAHAALVTSPIARGRITGIDLDQAWSGEGVLHILTHRELASEIRPVAHLMQGGAANSSWLPLGSDEIAYAGQIIALVVAESRDAAQAAAARARFQFEEWPAAFGFDDAGAERIALADLRPAHTDPAAGDADAALGQAPFQVDLRTSTPIQHHNPMELFTTSAAWEGDRLTIYEPTRFLVAAQHGLAEQLGLDPARVRVVAPFIGGHFGSKLGLSQHTAPVAVAARRLGRPVKLTPTRAQCFTIANYRPQTRHRVRLGGAADGRLLALVHEAETVTSRFDDFAMQGTDVTASLYACPAIRTAEHVVRVDRNTPGPMRAPPEMPYLFALESAVDALAARLGLDPIELRRRNDTMTDPVSGKPFSTRPLMRCFDAGAAAFGWNRRARSSGDWLTGFGCASAVRPVKIAPASVRVVLHADGHAEVETAHHEIGNGVQTLLAMLVGDGLGLPPEAVMVRLGDTALPPAGISGGSSTTTSLAHAVRQACAALRAEIGVPEQGGDPLALLRQSGQDRIAVLSTFIPAGAPDDARDRLRCGKIALDVGGDHLSWAFGAQFAEVRIHRLTGEIRVPRLLGAFAAGAVLNPLAARSQLEGGMIWGLGSALLEATALDRDTGRALNDNLSEYLLATAADTVRIEALLLDDADAHVNPMGIKGLGELGIVGVNAAIANALHQATGVRACDLPIRIESILPHLGQAANR